jgi:predicted Fe-Mo cluster-binding NifX family protein
MNKIGFVTAFNRKTTKLSSHFGMAKWVMILDKDSGKISFIQNTGLTGRAVLEILIREGCDDVVFRNIGPGAFKQMQTVNIAGWHAIEDKAVLELAEDLFVGRLRLARKPTEPPVSSSRRNIGPP